MVTTSSRTLLSCAAACVTAAALAAQSPSVVPDAVSCATCSIRTVRTFSLGDTSGLGEMVSFPSAIARDLQGRFWVNGDGVPKVYAADGQFIKELGRKGKGPGEFANAWAIAALPGDSVLVIDGSLSRGTVFGPDLKMARSILFPGWSPRRVTIVRWPTLIWGNDLTSPPGRTKYPLHAISLAAHEAQVVRSFGEAGDTAYGANSRVLSPPRGGTVWTANTLFYQLTQLDIAGEMRVRLVRTPQWFATQSMAWMGNPRTPPPPSIAGVWEGADGLVWVFVSVPSPHWGDAWDRVRGSTAIEYPASAIDIEKLFVTTVEVIDPLAKRVVARTTLDSYVRGVMADGSVWSLESDDDGRRSVRVTTLALERAPTAK
jgi:hypothetical protein